MAPARIRVALGLVSLAAVGLELVVMRGLSVRFWSHLAYTVIAVALLGFAASGTALTLLRASAHKHFQLWAGGLALLFAVSIPWTWWLSCRAPLDVGFLAWNPAQAWNVVLIELLMLAPFLLAGGLIGVCLMDEPARIGGHYAANLLGSGAGALGAVLLMFLLSTHQLLLLMAGAAYLAGLILLPWRRFGALVATVLAGAGILAGGLVLPAAPPLSPYKMLAQALTWPRTELVYQAEGPLGRIDAVAGPSLHYAPGLSLQYTDPLPPHALLIVDADQVSAVYDCPKREDWRFLDFTTAAAGYHLLAKPRVCVIGAGGGEQIGLALFHDSPSVTGLEMNAQVIRTMIGPLADRGGRVYESPGVRVINREARGYLAEKRGATFDLIQLPALDAFGASGAGLYAAHESYLYTTEAIGAMLARLEPGGVLSITRWARTPPRDELRAFDTAAQALRSKGLDPAGHLAMIRSWATVTILAFKQPMAPPQADALRAFCRDRCFDLCYLPDLKPEEVNRYHALEQPYYYEAAQALLGRQRESFLAGYVFEVAATTDDKPYFFHSFRWGSLAALAGQLHAAGRAFWELGYLLAVAAFVQVTLLGAALIVLPLAPGLKAVRRCAGKTACLVYFLAIGIGFMLLEIGFLQKLILYLAHPIYSAAVVIAGFLVFAGLGSRFSSRWPTPRRVALVGAAVVAGLGLLYLVGMDRWLAAFGTPWMAARFAVALATIAPLGLAMGVLFPSGLRQVGQSEPALVPWCWAVNGLASVLAAAGAPLLAMRFGLSRVLLVSIVCYVLAGLTSRFLPRQKSGHATFVPL